MASRIPRSCVPLLTRLVVGAVAVAGLGTAACSGSASEADDPAPTSTRPAAEPTTTTLDAPSATATGEAPAPGATEPRAAPAPSTTDVPSPADAPSRYPDQPAGVPWPTDAWAEAPLPDGIDVAAIDAAVDEAFGADDNQSRLRSIIAVHGGAIVYERYHPLDGPDTIFDSFSVAKSVTSTLVGMLVDDGRLDVDAPAPIDEWQSPGDPRADITIADLLHMSSGIDWTEAYGPDDVAGQMLRSDDWAEFVIGRPLESEPGTTFEYSTGSTAVLAEIVADQVGGPEALTDFLETELMEPLGITSTELLVDPSGQFVGGTGFDSTARDFARFGLLALRGGTWDGEQIVSSEWLADATTPSPTEPDYGAQWWLDDPPGTFAAHGLFGQTILVAPDLDLVVVVTATFGGDSRTPLLTVHDQFAGRT